MKQNENGFAGFVELLLIAIVLFVILAVGFSILHRKPQNNPMPVANVAANGFHDTPECAAFNNYANEHISMPTDFGLKMRTYQRCGNFVSFESEPQLVLLGYQSSKSFQNGKTLLSYVSKWFGQNGWQLVNNSGEDMASFKTTNLGATVRIIAYSPATVEINLESLKDFKNFPSTTKSSPPQILLSTQEQIRSAPFNVYRPTLFPYLASSPPKDSSDISSSFEKYLGLSYFANGLLIDYYSTQTNTALDNCNSGTISRCEVWATTKKGYKIYINSNEANKDSIKDITGLYLDIGNTDIIFGGDLKTHPYSITKSQIVEIVDSLEIVN